MRATNQLNPKKTLKKLRKIFGNVRKSSYFCSVIKMITNLRNGRYTKQQTIMKNLVRNYPLLEDELFKAYDILSSAGFEILIEDGMMQVWPKRASIEMDAEEGMVIIDDNYRDEYEERQEELYEL